MADHKDIAKAYNLGFNDARSKTDRIEAVIDVLVGDLDNLGFKDPDEEVCGADLVDLMSQWLPALRKIVEGVV